MAVTLMAARANKRLTQKEAAELIGVSSRTIYLWEHQKCFPDAKQISKIEEVYGLPYSEIIFLPSNVD